VNKTRQATLVGSISIFLWGTLALFTRFTGGEIPAFQMMSMTFFVAFLLMNIRWWRQGHIGVHYIRQPVLSWVIGLSGLFGYHFFYFLAMSKAPAVEVSLLAYLWPLLIVLLAALLPEGKLRGRHLIGALLSFVGCWVLIGKGSGSGFNTEYLSGYLMAFSCALIWSIYSVTSRLVKTVPTDAVGWFCGVTAALALVCHIIWENTVWPNSIIQWSGIIGLGLGPVGIAFFTWDYGVKHGNLQLLGVLAYAAPLISVILLVVVGESQLSYSMLVACLMIVGGSVFAGVDMSRKNNQKLKTA
jgi:drug/metabolite transporter (DMT)-like permease